MSIEKVLFFSHDAKLGDAVVNTAFVDGLRRAAPNCRIDATVAGSTAQFWQSDTRLGTRWPLFKPARWATIWRLGLALRRERYDYIVTWQRMRSEKNRLLLWLARPGAVIDLHAFNRGPVQHRIEACREALAQMQLPAGADLAYRIGFAARCGKLDALLPAGAEAIVLNLFAGDSWRNIGPDDAVAILRGLAGVAPQATLCLVCTDDTEALACQALAQAGVGGQLVNCQDSLERLIDVCGRASLVISPDTSLVHIASALGTPVIGIYQNNGVKALQWGPRAALHALVLSDNPDNLSGFAVAQLLEQAVRLLAARRRLAEPPDQGVSEAAG